VRIPDINVLLYAQNPDVAQHEACRRWLEDSLSGTETVGLPWIVVIGFIRLSTSARVFPMPMRSDEAIGAVRSWLEQPNATTVAPGPRHLAILAAMLDRVGNAAGLTTDAHIAAIASEHGATVVTCDTDFHRFPDLRVLDPTH
jgi:toxin-antitoxin system PIN domain toxin